MTNAERLAAIDEKLRVLDSDPNGVLALADEKWLAARVRELEAALHEVLTVTGEFTDDGFTVPLATMDKVRAALVPTRRDA